MPVPRAARRGATDSVVSLSRLSEAPTASVRAVSPTADRIWCHSCASWGVQPQVFAPPAACAVGPRLCRAQRPIHTHWVANTHRHGTYDSANRPACTVARVCAQRGRCRVHTCQCLLRANQRTKQAEPQPRGIHSAHHAQAGRSSTIRCRLGLALAPARALLRTCTCAKDKGNRGAKWPVDGRCADACQSVNFNR